jgi:flagellar hook-associated protein 2
MAGTLSSVGIGSGLDVNKIVKQLVAADRKPGDTKIAHEKNQVKSKMSALAQLKGALSTFQTALDTLKDPATFQVRTAHSSDADLFTVSAESTATPGSHSIEIDQLATAQKLSSSAYAKTAAVGTGTLTLSIDGQSTDIAIGSANNTLAGIRDAINSASDNPGVTATIIHADDGSHLQIVSNDTGIANAATVTTAGGDTGLENFVSGLTATTAAKDASIKVDGFSYSGASNTISGVIDGVTLKLKSADAQKSATFAVKTDQGAAKSAVEKFVTSYNNFEKVVKSLSSYDPDSKQAGPLLGDPTLLNITSRVHQALNRTVNDTGGAIQGLAAVGISFKVDGTLDLDGDKLDQALDANFDAVGQLFGAKDGYATSLDNVLDGYLETGGIFDTRNKSFNQHLDRIADDQAALNRRMDAEQKRYLAQFNALDTLVSKLKSTGDFLTRQFNIIDNTTAQQSSQS